MREGGRHLAAVVVLAASSLAAPAQAEVGPQTSWTAPRAISRPDTYSLDAHVVTDAAGTTTVAWGAWLLDGGDPGDNRGLVVRRKPAGGPWGPELVLDENGEDGPEDLVVDPDGNLTIAYGQYREGHPGWAHATKPLAVTGDASGTYGEPVLLGPDGRLQNGSMRLAVGPGGGVVAAWITILPDRTRRVTAALRPAGGAWQPATYLSGVGTRPSGALDVSAGAGGHATILWVGHRSGAGKGRSQVRARTLSGGTWSPATTLARAPATRHVGVVSSGRGGAAVAAWVQRPDTGFEAPDTVDYAARRADGGWTPPRTIPGSRGQLSSLDVVQAGDRVLAAWTTWDAMAGHAAGRAAVHRRGTWERPVEVAGPYNQEFGLDAAGDERGRFRLTWASARLPRTSDRVQGRVLTRHRTRAGTWSGAVRLTARGRVVFDPRVAVGPNASAAVVWTRWDGSLGCCGITYAETKAP